MDRQVIVAPEALAAFFALVGLLTCGGRGRRLLDACSAQDQR